MSTLQERIAEVMAKTGLSVGELSRLCGVSSSAVTQWKEGHTKSIKPGPADKLARATGYSALWLATGEGPMRNAPAAPPHAQGPAAFAPVAAAEDDAVAYGYVRLENLSPEPAMGDGAVLDEPIQVVRQLDVWEQWLRQKVGSANPERIRVLTARGRSMLPTIQDQDLVFVDVWQREIREPGIYVVDVAGRLLLKKALIQSTGTLILRSDNVEEYPDEERHDLEKVADTINVAGRVLAWWTLRRG
ncbi:helix-turn-helix transcriptional regulator [Pulveribacter sp.]|uniref:LexA family transcriptional regulator n=1 Tax=Pulveribacter sp. TaxID=2678893 RepID=UPI0028B0356B|nr:S24 family peptidase [Pulveribacter sp.]